MKLLICERHKRIQQDNCYLTLAAVNTVTYKTKIHIYMYKHSFKNYTKTSKTEQRKLDENHHIKYF